MLAYRLRHIVTFEHLTDGGRDPVTGYPIDKEWKVVTLDNGVKLENIHAEVLTGPGREPHIAGADWGEVTARINLRWFPADEMEMYKWRIVWQTASGALRYFNIKSVETDLTARVEWRIKCTGGLNAG